MKYFKKIMAATMFFLMVFNAFGICAVAQENAITVKILNYNVAGLPKFDGTDGDANHKTIADYIVENEFDIAAV